MIFIIFLFFNIPAASVSIVTLLGTESYASIQSGLYTYFLCTLICLFMPFVFLGLAPEAYKKIRRTFNWNSSAAAVVPTNFPQHPMQMLPIIR